VSISGKSKTIRIDTLFTLYHNENRRQVARRGAYRSRRSNDLYLKSRRRETYRETRSMMNPRELEDSLEKEIEGRVTERLEQKLREFGVAVVT